VVFPHRIPSIPTPIKTQGKQLITPILILLVRTLLIPLLLKRVGLPSSLTHKPPRSTSVISSRNTSKSSIEAFNKPDFLNLPLPTKGSVRLDRRSLYSSLYLPKEIVLSTIIGN